MAPTALSNSMKMLLDKRKMHSSFRQLTTTSPTSIDFSSNDFLSLSTSRLLKSAFLNELKSHPDFRLGSGGSRLLDGNSPYALALEREIASFHQAPSALLFNSGFDANSAFFACVPQPGDLVFYDAFIHASVHEGMRLSRAAKCLSFAHNCVRDLGSKISAFLQRDAKVANGERNVFIAIESLYSMDGDLAPIREIVELVEKMLPGGNGHVIVDEAHSSGIYGEDGRGIVCSLGLESRIFARLHTFGKALGCNGAALLCDSLTREYLINYARPLIYTTAMSFPSLAAIKSAYTLMRRGDTKLLVLHLNELISYMFHELSSLLPYTQHPVSGLDLLQLPTEAPRSPIFALLTPEPRSLAKHCQTAGFVVRPIVPPTVPEGTQRVRVCLHAGNSFDEVERLVARIRDWLKLKRRAGLAAAEEQPSVKALL